jgi:hypothetical protein
MGKRGAAPAKVTAKREKLSPAIAEIQDALKKVSHLPETCSAMLAAVTPHSLGIASEMRDEDQAIVVQWIEGVLEKQQAALVRETEAALEKLRGIEASKAQLQADVEKAEVALAEEKDKLPVFKNALAECTIAMTTTKKMLAERQEEQRLGDADHVSKKKDLEEFERVFEDDFKVPLAAGEALNHDKLQPFIASLDVEDSFMSSVEASCCQPKEQRSNFQAMVLEELEKAFLSRREQLNALAEVGRPAADERAAAVQQVEDELTKQRTSQEAAAAGLAEAQKNVETRAEMVKNSLLCSRQLDGTLEEASRFCIQTKAILVQFELGPLKTFRTCKEAVAASPVCATAGA